MAGFAAILLVSVMANPFRIVSIVGARPQFVKAAAVSRAINACNRHGSPAIAEKLIHTGQHYDGEMSEVFFNDLDIPRPHYNLGVGSGTHGRQTGKMLEKIEQVLLKEKPDMCLVYGDTNSTLAGALAAVKLHIPVAHVEAGLRCADGFMPEQINRVTVDHICQLLLCPSATAVRNLSREGISRGAYCVGDVMYDCVMLYRERIRALQPELMTRLAVQPAGYHLVTVHRQENVDQPDRLQAIFDAVNQISSSGDVVLPLHPRTKKNIAAFGTKVADTIKVTGPLSYLQMTALESNASIILTDSGGVQKEAYWFGVPCVTLREHTEWVETVQAGWNILAGTDPHRIIAALQKFRNLPPNHNSTLYGDGHAAEHICRILTSYARQQRRGSRGGGSPHTFGK
jgi:UDP-N-acetylglucosamine 2-epimerase